MSALAEKFWIIWSPTGHHTPKHRHETWTSAVSEAERLARMHPGSEFIVMGAETSRRVDNMQRVDFAAMEVPF